MRRSLFLLKKQVGWFAGGARTPFGRAFRKGTALKFRASAITAATGTNDVSVSFTAPPAATNYATGVTITVNGGARNVTGTAVDKTVVTYTIDGAALAEGDVIVWAYDAGVGDYQSVDGEILETQTLTYTIPVVPSGLAWELESGTGNWQWESGADIELESS